MEEVNNYKTLFGELKKVYEAFGIRQIVSEYYNLAGFNYRTEIEESKIKKLHNRLKWWNDERVNVVDQAYKRLIEKGIDGIKSPERYLITPNEN